MKRNGHELYGSWIELSESALAGNIRFLKRLAGRGVEFCSVIKGNAYGHGIEVFVPLAQRCGVRCFATFSADEAARVLASRNGPCDVMIMGDIPDEAIGWAIENDLSFYVFDLKRLDAALRTARKIGKPARVHLEVETGLNRTGFNGRSLDRAAQKVFANPDAIRAEGVCTHFAGAESVSNYVRIQEQIDRYNRQCERLGKHQVHPRRRHTACSAASMNYPETRMDLVRIGIAHYGFWPTRETRMQYFMRRHKTPGDRRDPLRRVMSWKSRIMSIKSVRSGEFVGYGISHQASRRERLAAIPVGYYHGFARNLSNLGYVLVRGERAPVVGLVNMNMLMADITDIAGARRGDEVVVIGRQNGAEISVNSFSDMSNNVNYEVLVRIPYEIPRVVVA